MGIVRPKKDPVETKKEYATLECHPVVAQLKKQLRNMRVALGETDEDYPHVKQVIDQY